MIDKSSAIWNIVDTLRMKGMRPDPLTIVQAARDQGIAITFEQIRIFLSRDLATSGLHVLPDYIPLFVNKYLRNAPPQSILDPWAGIGSMLVPVAKEQKVSRAVGMNRSREEHDLALILHDQIPTIEWRLGHPLHLLDDLEGSFDLVISAPPVGYAAEAVSIDSPHGSVPIRDALGNLVMIKAASKLAPEGTAFFVTNLGWRKDPRGVYHNLSHFGLFLEAELALPAGVFGPSTRIPASLLVIRRQASEKLFVGELTSDADTMDVLLKNLKTRKESKIPQLGALVDPEYYHTFQAFVAGHELEALSRIIGVPRAQLAEFALEINLSRRDGREPFIDKPNSVYLPLIGRSPAVSSLADLSLKPHNYAQIVLDSDKSVAAYAAEFFNTGLGQKVRESLVTGSTIPKLTLTALLSSPVYLPDFSTQTEVVGINGTITNLATQLDTMRRQLWSQPRKARDIQRALQSVGREDSFEAWLETLPFPLASILWIYHADPNPEHKLDHLIHFFEALSEFAVTVLLSALASDRTLYDQLSKNWLDTDPRYREWYLTATFGGWNTLGARIAKETRRLLSDPNNRQTILEIFGSPNPEFVEMITNKDLFVTLEQAADHRNTCAGHTGIRGQRHTRNCLALLEASLAQARRIISDRFSEALLLSPERNEFRDGVYRYQVKALVGTRTTFRRAFVNTILPMDSQKLYLLHANELKPLELLPFLQLMESPDNEQNACYFYNRVHGDSIRWISYHFESEAEVLRPDARIQAAFSLFRSPDEAV